MQITLAPAGRKAVAVITSKHKTPSLRRYRRRWVQNRFGLSKELANVVADLAFANRRGRL
jgi:hypothetical protein